MGAVPEYGRSAVSELVLARAFAVVPEQEVTLLRPKHKKKSLASDELPK